MAPVRCCRDWLNLSARLRAALISRTQAKVRCLGLVLMIER
jgi:hypothetical protein